MLTDFIRQLFLDGRVRLQSSEPATAEELHDAAAWLITVEPDLRQHLPDVPPQINSDALRWSIRMFYRAAQIAVFRDLGAEEIDRSLCESFAVDDVTPSTVYSVDLVFRCLPDLIRIVNGMNPDDPLLAVLKEWATQWPLSSVGVEQLEVWMSNPS